MGEGTSDELWCQFLIGNLNGSYRDDVHEAEPVALARHHLLAAFPLGSAILRTEIPFRRSRFEYVVFRGSRQLGHEAELLVRFRFDVNPR